MRPNDLLRAALAAAALLAAPATAQRQTPMDGIYIGLKQNVMTDKVYFDYLTFGPNGRVLRGSPTGGLALPVNWAAECANAQCGTYRADGGTVHVAWTGGDAWDFDVEPGGALKKHGREQRFRPLAMLNGLRLDGRYAVEGESGGRAMVEIAFTPDGRFREQGLMQWTRWAEQADPAARARQKVDGGQGTYSIRRNTLELRYDGGPVARFFISLRPNATASARPDAVMIDTSIIDRAK